MILVIVAYTAERVGVLDGSLYIGSLLGMIVGLMAIDDDFPSLHITLSTTCVLTIQTIEENPVKRLTM